MMISTKIWVLLVNNMILCVKHSVAISRPGNYSWFCHWVTLVQRSMSPCLSFPIHFKEKVASIINHKCTMCLMRIIPSVFPVSKTEHTNFLHYSEGCGGLCSDVLAGELQWSWAEGRQWGLLQTKGLRTVWVIALPLQCARHKGRGCRERCWALCTVQCRGVIITGNV